HKEVWSDAAPNDLRIQLSRGPRGALYALPPQALAAIKNRLRNRPQISQISTDSTRQDAGPICAHLCPSVAKNPVVVLNPHYTGLGIARNLGPLGIRVLGLTHEPGFPGNHSRWLEYRASPDSLSEPEALCAFLTKLADELGRPAVLFPTRDHDLNFVNRHREELEARYLLPFAGPEGLDRVLNKDRLFAAAEAAGLRVPRGVTLHGHDDLDRARGLTYPVVCKPSYASQWRKPGIWEAVGRSKASRFETFDELARFHKGVAPIDPHMTVQEWIPGGERSLLIFGSHCAAGGEPTAFFTARKRLQYPALLGTGIVVEALPLPELEAPSRALLKALDFHGISEIELKRHEGTGELHLIEVNPRHWDQHRLGTAVGVNLSEAAYRDATGQPPRPMPQQGKRALWVAEHGFARHAARALLGREPLGDLREVFGAKRTWGVLDPRDIRPFLAMLGLLRKPRSRREVR
ncbi:MAG: hypothetical protein ACNA8S_17430, partial [Deferrisomatales bacterium]